VVFQILTRDDAAVLLHSRSNLLGQRPFVERVRAIPCDRLKRIRKVALHQPIAAAERNAIGFEKDFRRRSPAYEPRLRTWERVGKLVVNREALARELDRGCDQLRERELARAVTLVRERKTRNGSRNTDAKCAVARLPRIR